MLFLVYSIFQILVKQSLLSPNVMWILQKVAIKGQWGVGTRVFQWDSQALYTGQGSACRAGFFSIHWTLEEMNIHWWWLSQHLPPQWPVTIEGEREPAQTLPHVCGVTAQFLRQAGYLYSKPIHWQHLAPQFWREMQTLRRTLWNVPWKNKLS